MCFARNFYFLQKKFSRKIFSNFHLRFCPKFDGSKSHQIFEDRDFEWQVSDVCTHYKPFGVTLVHLRTLNFCSTFLLEVLRKMRQFSSQHLEKSGQIKIGVAESTIYYICLKTNTFICIACALFASLRDAVKAKWMRSRYLTMDSTNSVLVIILTT